jgi:hypothetical protein
MPYSTFVAPQYFRANFMTQVTYKILDPTTGAPTPYTELDPLSDTLQTLVDSLQTFTLSRWTGQQFTTLVYQAYGNTTLIWLVLMVNGMISRTELRKGMIIRWPVMVEIQAAMNSLTLAANSVNDVILI